LSNQYQRGETFVQQHSKFCQTRKLFKFAELAFTELLKLFLLLCVLYEVRLMMGSFSQRTAGALFKLGDVVAMTKDGISVPNAIISMDRTIVRWLFAQDRDNRRLSSI